MHKQRCINTKYAYDGKTFAILTLAFGFHTSDLLFDEQLLEVYVKQ